MGAANRKPTTTAQFIEQFPDCFFCGGQRRSTTREHMPPKSLFDNSHRPNKLVMPACRECNCGTSTADLIAAVVSRFHYAPRSQEIADYNKLIARVRKQAPDLLQEWTRSDDVSKVTLGPLTIRQLNLFAHKAVLALFFEHARQPLPITGGVCAYWKSREEFAQGGIPQFLLDMLPEYGTLVQGKWNESKTFQYRHAANAEHGFFGCIAKLRRGLLVTGFAATNASVLRPDDGIDWIIPTDPVRLLDHPRFQKKL